MHNPTVSLPSNLIVELEAWGQHTASIFGALRQQAGLPPKGVPDDQAWFWTPEWQAGEREVDEAYARGEYEVFENVEDALTYLHSQT
ncbi:MAG: hypothetical protein H6673_15520 [Anaerolineales bacterium]|nr:hypothetical protein [Anaerolineales bacterium]